MHRRARPKVHALRYRAFWLLLDLDEIDDLDKRCRLFSRNRFNLFSFHDRDHGEQSSVPLRRQLEALLGRAGLTGSGPIRLLTMPRVLGYVFNPISVYYCFGAGSHLQAIIYEVTSTFGVRHSYVIPVAREQAEMGHFTQACAKALYVSPFMEMDMSYRFDGKVPDDRLSLCVRGFDAEGLLITATIAARRQPLDDRTIARNALAIPLLTLKVVAAIHWQALKLWLKGVPLTSQPPPPADSASITGIVPTTPPGLAASHRRRNFSS